MAYWSDVIGMNGNIAHLAHQAGHARRHLDKPTMVPGFGVDHLQDGAEAEHIRTAEFEGLPDRIRQFSAASVAAATSWTNTGWKRLSPAMTGRTGANRAMAAKRLRNWSSGPMTRLGRRIVAAGIAARTPASPSPLLRA
jgi:hypothetical protein